MTATAQSLWENPLGTDGFEFVEYAAPDPAALGHLFEQMGFAAIARHRSKKVLPHQQGDINFIEIMQRNGNEGFGEGNFRVLFGSIELDQIRRGVLKA